MCLQSEDREVGYCDEDPRLESNYEMTIQPLVFPTALCYLGGHVYIVAFERFHVYFSCWMIMMTLAIYQDKTLMVVVSQFPR